MASDELGPKSPAGFPLGHEAVGEITDETAASVIELSGVIKWFDVSKGYGFIVPDNGLPDILLHVTCLRRDGFQTAYEGARVVCEVLQRPRGLQAFRILSMDESTAVHPTQMPPARTHVTVAPTSGLERAQVKWFNRLRGFGFLTRGEGPPDIFLHMQTSRRHGLTAPRPRQTVLPRYRPRPTPPLAAHAPPAAHARPPAPPSHLPPPPPSRVTLILIHSPARRNPHPPRPCRARGSRPSIEYARTCFGRLRAAHGFSLCPGACVLRYDGANLGSQHAAPSRPARGARRRCP